MTDGTATRIGTVFLVVLGAAATTLYACGASPTPPLEGTPDTGGGGVDAGRDGALHTDASPDGAGDGAQDAQADHPEDISVEAIGPPDTGSVCNLTGTWGAPTTVLTTAAADATIFGAVTPDELTLAWTSSVGGVVTAWYADRSSATAAFGAPQALNSSFGTLAMDRVTLSGNGLRVAGVASNGQSLVAAERAARPNAFDTVDQEFASLGGTGESQPTYATPLLAGDDSEFLYLVTSSSTNNVLYESKSGLPWTNGVALSASQLARSGTSYRRPSGLSLDGLTLFYWDEVSGSEKMTTRASRSQSFGGEVDIGALTNAFPTAS
jgi:hypothetical protein